MRVKERKVSKSLPRVPVARLVGHEGPIQAVRFTADGKYCLTGAIDRSIRLWNPSRLDPAFPPRPDDGLSGLIDQDIPVSSLPRALPIQTYRDGYAHPISALAVDQESNTTMAAASDRTLVITDLVTQQAKRRFQGHAGRINAVAISQGSETYLSASYDATVRIWDGRSRSSEAIQVLKEAKDSITAVHTVQNDDDTVIRTASVDGVVRTYDLRKGVIRCDDCGTPVVSCVPTRDGQGLAVSGLDGNLRLLDIDSGELLNVFSGHHVASQYSVECSITADDTTIVTGSEDGKVVLYDLVRATPVQSLLGHSKPTCAVAAHPGRDNTSTIVSASYDGDAVVWANDFDYIGWQE